MLRLRFLPPANGVFLNFEFVTLRSGSWGAGVLRGVLLGTLTVISAVVPIQSAQAQFWLFGYPDAPRYRRPTAPVYHAPVYHAPVRRERGLVAPRRAARIEAADELNNSAANTIEPKKRKKIDEVVEVKPGLPLYAVISIEDQHVSIYGSNGLIERSDVSTGTEQHPTPTGIYAIIQKERWHESNLYSGAPMPFMQRITWSGVAMHTGQLPGYPASHGCIRLPGSFAERWYGMTKLGLRVLIAPTDVVPEPLAHAKLPVPRYWTAAGVAAVRKPVQSAGLSDDSLAVLALSSDLVVNPIGYAVIEKQNAKAKLKQSELAESTADGALEAANKALREAAIKLKMAEREVAAAQERMAWFGLIGNRTPPSPRANFGEGVIVARATYEAANSKLGDAVRVNDAAKLAVAQAMHATKFADERTEALKNRITEMGRRQETVSILISRKDGRMYVRQALRPVLELPVKIRDADVPIGNHVFMASPPAVGERALRWTALTMPIETVPKVSRSKRDRDIETGSIATAIPAESAIGALDRLELSGEVMDQLAEYVWAGASIIISDHGITHETGAGTDFVIETKH